jgi:tRNA U34 5-methylaminomethyl-2-thiouridine-forming methyltransferase MnmC
MDFQKFNWIRTRDGSPTLWHNGEGAAFRSQKGAFTESLCAFVRPAIEDLHKRAPVEARVVEFGLGPGTNWALWNLSLMTLQRKGLEISSHYTAIEKDPESFDLGLSSWLEDIGLLTSFIASEWDADEIPAEEARAFLKNAKTLLRVVPSLDSLISSPASSLPADVWFHDPFGFDINPSAYQSTELSRVRELLAPEGRAYSYACNTPFQKALKASGFDVSTLETGNTGLKRERLEFWPALIDPDGEAP